MLIGLLPGRDQNLEPGGSDNAILSYYRIPCVILHRSREDRPSPLVTHQENEASVRVLSNSR